MSLMIRGATDEILERIAAVLRNYQSDHPDAEVVLYRQNPVSVRIRIVDPSFAGQTRVRRSEDVWRYLDRVPEDDASDISTVLLLTPEETSSSFANFDFDNPTPSLL